jgi:hypothetical protein
MKINGVEVSIRPYANLRGANLRGADLYGADLYGANLRGAKYSARTWWPAPTMLLLANWGLVDDDLTTALMRLDASCHPDPAAFDRWAADGPCPYDGVPFERAANFQQQKALWSPGSVSPMWCVQELLRRYLVVGGA